MATVHFLVGIVIFFIEDFVDKFLKRFFKTLEPNIKFLPRCVEELILTFNY